MRENAKRKSIGLTNQSRHTRDAGFTIIEAVVVLLLIGAVLAFVIPMGLNAFATINRNNAHLEIQAVINASHRYRTTFANGGLYTGISIKNLHDKGYGLDNMATGVAQNVYGKDVDIDPTTGGVDAKIVYDTPSAVDCAALLDRFKAGTSFVPGVTAAACSTNDLSITID